MAWWQYCLLGVGMIFLLNFAIRGMNLISTKTRVSTPFDVIERDQRLRAKEGLALGTPYDFFISYKSDDVMLVRPVVEQLLAEGYRVWFAEYTIPLATQTIHDPTELDRIVMSTLDSAIEKSKMGICFTNAAYLESSWCCNEMAQLLAEKGPSKVFVIELTPDDRLGERFPTVREAHWLPYTSLNAALTFIADALGQTIQLPPTPSEAVPDIWRIPFGIYNIELDFGGWTLDSPQIKIVNGDEPTLRFSRACGSYTLSGNFQIGEMAYSRRNYRSWDGTDDRAFYRRGMQFTKGFVQDLPIATRCVGLHLLHHADLSHLAFTTDTFIQKQWIRVYSMGIPGQGRQHDVEVHFTFGLIGPFEDYCRYIHLADALVTTLDWSLRPMIIRMDDGPELWVKRGRQ